MRTEAIFLWGSLAFTILGTAGIGAGMYLTEVDVAGSVQEPWGIIGPSIWMFFTGAIGILVTTALIIILSYRKQSKQREERDNAKTD
ncbi:hypothetical protein [Brucella intermedia]|uniref:hypothetical protein n=1 Tax=Brucella intermedia TaxID=94625 RepID=UPI00235EA466|nr:hypothetical protein [Brucella intermedia]